MSRLLEETSARGFAWRIGLLILAPALLAALAALAWSLYRESSSEGLLVTYYRDQEFRQVARERTHRRVAVDYETDLPWGVPGDRFFAVWEGFLTVPATADYVFFAKSERGIRVLLDDEPLIENRRDRRPGGGVSAEKRLASGLHRVRIEHWHLGGEASIYVSWAGGPIPLHTTLAAPYIRKDAGR